MNTKELDIINIEYLKRLESLKDQFFSLKATHGVEKGISQEFYIDDYEWYCEEEYLEQLQWNQHVGFPETYNAINLPQLKNRLPDIWSGYLEEVKNKTAEMLGAHTSALALFYPPRGFVGWHTNENSASYQILFTWSETGDGYFRYQDPKTKEIFTLQDKPGWNVRYHYFGDTEEDKLWHCAYTHCNRFSFAYKYVGKESKGLFEMAIEEIQSV